MFHNCRSVPLRRTAAIVLVAAFAATLGCSKFRSSRRMDLTPFAENMIAIAGDIQYGLAQQEMIYLRDYMSTPEVDSMLVYLRKMRAVMRGSIAYSIEVVTLSNSTLSGPEQANALANYIDDLIRPVLEAPAPDLHLTTAQLDTIVSEVRKQDNLLDALNTSQPIVNEISRAASEIIDDANVALDEAVESIRSALYEDNREMLEGDRALRAFQLNAIKAIGYIGTYRRGDSAALDTLFAMQPSLREVVSSTKSPTPKDLAAIEQRMLFLLQGMHDIRTQLIPDIELYWKQQKELDELTKAYKAALRKAQVTTIAWARAHQRLASGVTDPAKIDVLGLAKKAAGAASPL